MNYVQRVINDWDPIDLLSHAPDDEYHTEVEKIQRMISMGKDASTLADGIFSVFVKSFGKAIFNKSKAECEQIAQMLLSKKA